MAKSLQGLTTRKSSKITRVRKFGFRSRAASSNGKNVLKRRRDKKRASLSVSPEFGSKMEKNKKFSRRK